MNSATKQTSMNDLFRKGKEDWLQSARDEAKKLLKRRYSITIEDVLEVCPKPTYLHRNTIGSVFNGDFVPVGFTKSKRLVSKGRYIRQWRLRHQ
jgi:hypothetical protein